MPISREIRVKIDYSKMPHNNFAKFAKDVYKTLHANRFFPNPPVDLETLHELAERYDNLVTAAMDGGKTVISQRNSLRNQVDHLVRQLGYYVQHHCHNDPAIFATTVFEAYPQSHAPAADLTPPQILKITHGPNSGGVRVYLSPSLRKIKQYVVRYGLQDGDAPPESWETVPVPSADHPVSLTNLKPGKRYAFQVQGLKSLGLTDWSDSVLFMCT